MVSFKSVAPAALPDRAISITRSSVSRSCCEVAVDDAIAAGAPRLGEAGACRGCGGNAAVWNGDHDGCADGGAASATGASVSAGPALATTVGTAASVGAGRGR